MCELEQHIMILRENGAPLSPSRILWHMRSINCHMGEGNQEDAHEFLRSFEIILPMFFEVLINTDTLYSFLNTCTHTHIH